MVIERFLANLVQRAEKSAEEGKTRFKRSAKVNRARNYRRFKRAFEQNYIEQMCRKGYVYVVTEDAGALHVTAYNTFSGLPVGWCDYEPHMLANDRTYLTHIFVNEDNRLQGIAKTMLRLAHRVAKSEKLLLNYDMGPRYLGRTHVVAEIRDFLRRVVSPYANTVIDTEGVPTPSYSLECSMGPVCSPSYMPGSCSPYVEDDKSFSAF